MERDKMTKEMKVAKTIRGGLSKDVLNISFDRLPDTKQEADAIEKVLKNKKKLKVKNYQGKNAIEEMIFSAETPKILHLATHGYFLNDEELKGSSETRGITIKLKEDFMAKDETANIENPMLRSGIVFSGSKCLAQSRKGRRHDERRKNTRTELERDRPCSAFGM